MPEQAVVAFPAAAAETGRESDIEPSGLADSAAEEEVEERLAAAPADGDVSAPDAPGGSF